MNSSKSTGSEPTPAGKWRKADGSLVPKRKVAGARKRQAENFQLKKDKQRKEGMKRRLADDAIQYGFSDLGGVRGYSVDPLEKILFEIDTLITEGEIVAVVDFEYQLVVGLIREDLGNEAAYDFEIYDEYRLAANFDGGETIAPDVVMQELVEPLADISIWSQGNNRYYPIDCVA